MLVTTGTKRVKEKNIILFFCVMNTSVKGLPSIKYKICGTVFS